MLRTLLKSILVISLFGRAFATDIQPIDIQHGHFPAEIMMKIFDYGNLQLKDVVRLTLTCKAFQTAFSSQLARKALWSQNMQLGTYTKRAQAIRSLGISEYEENQFRRMEISKLYAYCQNFALANKWRFDDNTETLICILAERLYESGSINVLIPAFGPPPQRQISYVHRMFERAHWLPSFSLIPCRFSISHAKMMHKLLGWQYAWRFIEPIPMWAGIFSYIAAFFNLRPLTSFIQLPDLSLYIMFLLSSASQFTRLLRFITNF